MTAQIQGDYVVVNWSASDPGSGLDTCRLQVRENRGGWTRLSSACVGEITYTNVRAGRSYTFRLQATDRVNNTVSESASLVYNGDPPQVSVEAQAQVQGDDIVVAWSASDAGSGLDACDLEMSTDGRAWENLSDNCAGTITPANVLAGQPYTFRFTATDNTGNMARAEDGAATAAVTKYYYFGGQRVAVRKPDGAVNWLHGDHLGSTSLATDGNGVEVSRQSYYPFGEKRVASGEMPTDFGYTGQRLDGTGLMFYHARYYAPTIGRFVSADTIVPQLENPQSLNRYSYVNNRPLRFIDPSGHDPCGEDPHNPDNNCLFPHMKVIQDGEDVIIEYGKAVRAITEWEILLLAAMAYFEEGQLGVKAMSAAVRVAGNRLVSERDLFANQHSILEVLEFGFQDPAFKELLGKVSLEQGDENEEIIRSFMRDKIGDDVANQEVWAIALPVARSAISSVLNEPDVTYGSLWFGNLHHHWLDDYQQKAGNDVPIVKIEPEFADWPQGKLLVANNVLSVEIPDAWLLPKPNVTPTPTPF